MKVSIIAGILLLGIRGVLVELGRISEFMRGFLLGSAGIFLVVGSILLIYYIIENKDKRQRNKIRANAGFFYGLSISIYFGIKVVERFLWEVPDYVAIPLYILASIMAIISVIRTSNNKNKTE